MASRLSREVAEASRALESELPARYVKPTHANLLVDVAKRLQRLQTSRAKLRKELRSIEREISIQKKQLKALAQQIGRGE